MATRKAYPDVGSGVNPNTPVRLFDTHPNRRIAVGEEVVKIDHEEPNVRGLVLGYCAEDRLWVRWPTVVAQEDVHDVMAMSELGNVISLKDSGIVVRPQSVHTPGAYPKKTAGSKKAAMRGARFSFRKVRSGGGHAFDVFVEENQVGTIRQTVKSGKRYWKLQGHKREKLYPTRKEAAEALCARRKCDAGPTASVVKAHQKAHLIRQAGVIDLDRAVRLLHKEGQKREAKITARLARTAMVMHLMHYIPATRRNASGGLMRSIWRTRVRLALRMTESLRKVRKGRYAQVADGIEVALQRAFTYPRQSLKVAAIQIPPPAFQAVFGTNTYQAWDEVLRRAQQRGINPMMANYQDVAQIMTQVQQEMQGQGVQYPQTPPAQMDTNQMNPSMQNMWFQQQQSIGNPSVPRAPGRAYGKKSGGQRA